MRLHVNEHAQ